MTRTAIVTWQDGSQTTLGIRYFRKTVRDTFMVQFPNFEWEEVIGCTSIRWAVQ